MIHEVERRTEKQAIMMKFDFNYSSCSSSGSSSVIEIADTQGTQPYLFEPYDSEVSSDSSNESDEADPFERLRNTDW